METQVKNDKNGQINIVLQNQKPDREYTQVPETNTGPAPFTDIHKTFGSLIGLDHLKQIIKEIYAVKIINQKRHDAGLHSTNQVLHMLFKGNPGTGKTTVARKLAHTYHEMNLLSKGHLIEAERADLVGEYIGQTAQKTRSMIKKAMGGILFVDEAYSLGRGGEKDFGKEAIDTLVKHMEDYHNDFVLILAGYPHEMKRFLTLNPGLKSRFPFIIDFDDYDTVQLMHIAEQMAGEREYKLTCEAKRALKSTIQAQIDDQQVNFSNARFVRNVLERAIRMHAIRIVSRGYSSYDDLIELTSDDIHSGRDEFI